MEVRTRSAVGGVAAVAASVAMIWIVALTTSASLADAPGATSAAGPVVVPSAAPSPAASATAPAGPVAPPAPAPVTGPETVSAPEPVEVAPAPAVPAPDVPVADTSAAQEEQVIAEAVRSGAWEAALAWAAQQGWTGERLQAWVSRLEALRAAVPAPPVELERRVPPEEIIPDPELAERAPQWGEGESAFDPLLSPPDPPSEHDLSGLFGSQRERSQVPPD